MSLRSAGVKWRDRSVSITSMPTESVIAQSLTASGITNNQDADSNTPIPCPHTSSSSPSRITHSQSWPVRTPAKDYTTPSRPNPFLLSPERLPVTSSTVFLPQGLRSLRNSDREIGLVRVDDRLMKRLSRVLSPAVMREMNRTSVEGVEAGL